MSCSARTRIASSSKRSRRCLGHSTGRANVSDATGLRPQRSLRRPMLLSRIWSRRKTTPLTSLSLAKSRSCSAQISPSLRPY